MSYRSRHFLKYSCFRPLLNPHFLSENKRLLTFPKQSFKLLNRHGFTKQVALVMIAAKMMQESLLLFRFHPFGNNVNIQGVSHSNNSAHNRVVTTVASHIPYE